MRFELFDQQPIFQFVAEARAFTQIKTWSEKTQTGDRNELDLPDGYNAWSELDAGRETCIGQKCKYWEPCFVTQMRRRAEGARLIVANHHLLCADLRVRIDSKREAAAAGDGQSQADSGFARVIPDVHGFILDEAHALPDVASDYFGAQASSGGVQKILAGARKIAERQGGDHRADVLEALNQCEQHSERLWVQLRADNDERSRLKLTPHAIEARVNTLDALKLLSGALTSLPNELLAASTAEPGSKAATDATMHAAERQNLIGRVTDTIGAIDYVLDRALEDPKIVVMSEPARRGTIVTAAPVDVAAALAESLFASELPVIMTSATLAVAGNTDAFAARVGATMAGAPVALPAAKPHAATDPDDAAVADDAPALSSRPAFPPPIVKGAVFASPFDYAKRSALYCPKDMPDPKGDPEKFNAAFLDECRFLLELSNGGALFLFTSHAGLVDGFNALTPVAAKLGVPLFKQGDAPKHKLLDELRKRDGAVGAALCATRSFWEGVDVRGRALRLVVVDRLPFEVPTDPLVKARADLCKARGGDPFRDITVPQAALALKQGAGRLLRDVDDAGVVAVLDGRLRSKTYGRVFLDTMPPMTRIGARATLGDFWRRFVLPALRLN